MRELITLGRDVEAALDRGRPIVALESSFLAQGLPSPTNLETAMAMVDAIRNRGAVPAMAAVMDGRIAVGLDDAAMDRLARTPSVKASRRDLGFAMSAGQLAATTVASTMAIAAALGIRIFATGGIGGVHRGAAETFDISADLPELARSPMAVVCSGAKSILDLPKTVEHLETLGIPIWGFAHPDFPAFHIQSSNLPVDGRLENEYEVAAALRAHWAVGNAGALVGVPVPNEAAVSAPEYEQWLLEAEAEAADQSITGKALTPFLLRRLSELSNGQTLRANVALLVENAKTAASIAVALGHASER
ncbi:MAG: pseudouridine-5'-phosphate glycosidase [Pseudomonadota bacterium]